MPFSVTRHGSPPVTSRPRAARPGPARPGRTPSPSGSSGRRPAAAARRRARRSVRVYDLHADQVVARARVEEPVLVTDRSARARSCVGRRRPAPSAPSTARRPTGPSSAAAAGEHRPGRPVRGDEALDDRLGRSAAGSSSAVAARSQGQHSAMMFGSLMVSTHSTPSPRSAGSARSSGRRSSAAPGCVQRPACQNQRGSVKWCSVTTGVTPGSGSRPPCAGSGRSRPGRTRPARARCGSTPG